MTAVSLYDVLARDASSGGVEDAGAREARLVEFAEKLIASSLAELSRIGEYERRFAWALERDPQADLQAMRSVWRMYFEWANDVEQVLARVDALAQPPDRIAGLKELNEAFGRTRARLTVTPEQIARAKEQARRGQIVPAKELRDELHARLRT